MNKMTAEHYLLKALQLEAQGSLTEAISFYKKAYALKPELDTSLTTFMVDGVEYDDQGNQVFNTQFNEEDRSYKDDFAPIPLIPEKFDPGDPKAAQYLEENGYVVFSQLANSKEVEKAKGLFWDHIENFTSAQRGDVSSWKDDTWPGDPTNGIIFNIGIGQSAFLWYLRTLPNVKKAFAGIWGDSDLLVSFDGCGVFRPVEYKHTWRTKGGWFHIDQNLYQKKGRHCVQGLVNLRKSGEYDGGFVVVPQSHKMMENAFAKYSDLCQMDGDYFRFERDADFWEDEKKRIADYSHAHALQPVKICLEPGDFVMWDSRTVHCNHPPTRLSDDPSASTSLKRLVAYICMSPAKMAKDLEDLIENRVFAFNNGISTSHWPHEFYPSSGGKIPGLGGQNQQIASFPDVNLLVAGSKYSEKVKL
jgi:hypothetical protein